MAWLLAVAVVGGVAITLQSQFIGLMESRLGTLESVFLTYGSGGLAVGLAMLAAGGGNLAEWRRVPWYALTAGLLGLVIVASISYTVPRLGLVSALTLLLTAQFIFAALVDHLGLLGAQVRPLDPTRMVGIFALFAGTWLVLR